MLRLFHQSRGSQRPSTGVHIACGACGSNWCECRVAATDAVTRCVMRHTPCTTHAATPCLTPCAIRHASCHAPRLPLLLSTCQFSTRKTKKAPSPMIQSRWRKASHPQTGRDMKSSTRSRACFLVGVRVGVRVRVRVRVLPQTLSLSRLLLCSRHWRRRRLPGIDVARLEQ